jgi:hypothetical protein
MTPTKTITSVCDLLLKGQVNNAKNELESNYPFTPVRSSKRAYSEKESMSVFRRDGFIDRYSGARLVFPGTLRLIHRLLPAEFPFHKNWKMSATHVAFWQLFPTIDHLIPVARDGPDVYENWFTTSQLRNCAKANWLLDELNWVLLPAGDIADWDGLTSWFNEYIADHPEHLSDAYIETWHRAANGFRSERPSPTPSPAQVGIRSKTTLETLSDPAGDPA